MLWLRGLSVCPTLVPATEVTGRNDASGEKFLKQTPGARLHSLFMNYLSRFAGGLRVKSLPSREG